MREVIKGFLSGFLVLGLMFGIVTVVLAGQPADKGFDQYGYNRTARNFVGTGGSWCADRGDDEDCLGALYTNDKLVMKWNAEWDRGNEEGWDDPDGYDAWLNNEWNGMSPNGSGETWHYMIAWDEGCANGITPTNAQKGDAYCIWGPFAMLMSHGTYDGAHYWDILLSPAGYGAY